MLVGNISVCGGSCQPMINWSEANVPSAGDVVDYVDIGTCLILI